MTYIREESVESYLVCRVKERGGEARKLVDLGRKGFPDRTCMFDNRHVFYVETKPPKGHEVYPWQARQHTKLRAMGYNVYVARTRGEVDRIMQLEGVG